MVVGLGVLLVGVIVGVYLFNAQDQQKPVDSSVLPALEAAQTSLPSSDVPGVDVSGLPRPTSSVRTYYLVQNSVITLTYNQRTALNDVRAEIEQRLPAAGWTPIAGVRSPGATVPTSSVWTATFADPNRVVQVSMFRNGDITSTTYLIQQQPTK